MVSKQNKKPWISLAKAIIASGVKENDTEFLESEWCELLKDLVACEDDTYPAKVLYMPNIHSHKE